MGLWSEMRPVYRNLLTVFADSTEPVLRSDVQLAGELADRYPRLSARDLIHVAVMQRVGATHIVTADQAFDDIEGIERLDSALVEEWKGLVSP